MKCYVGTNSLRGSKGIYTLEINTQNGEMREVSTVEADDSAYLYVSEKRKCLYAVMESLEYKGVPGGGVAAYRIEDNKLSFLNSRYAYGGWPCHVIADEEKDSLLVSVFRNGLLVVYGINQDGSIGEERRVEHHQEPNGRMSHIHASMPSRRPFLSSAELRGKCKSGCGWAIRFRSCSIGRLFVREYPSAAKPIWDGVYRLE